MSLLPFIQGFGLSASIIVVIGAQNAYVLNQGLKRRHSFLIPTLCALIDIVFIALGVGGLGYLINLHPLLIQIARWFGAVFLTGYGLHSVYMSFKPKGLKISEGQARNIKKTILTVLALSFLNPNVYLDNLVLIGSVSAQHPPEQRLAFALGAMLASTLWFYGITLGARILSPVLQSPKAWRIIDLVTATIMFVVAIWLIMQ